MTPFLSLRSYHSFYTDDLFHESRRIFHGGSEHFGHDYDETHNTHEHSPVYATQEEATKAMERDASNQRESLSTDVQVQADINIQKRLENRGKNVQEIARLRQENTSLKIQLARAKKENPKKFQKAELQSAIKFQCGNMQDNNVLAVAVHSPSPQKALLNTAIYILESDIAQLNIECDINGKVIERHDLHHLSLDQIAQINVESHTLEDEAESVAGERQSALDNVCIIAKAMRDPATAQYTRSQIKPTNDSVAKKIALRGMQEGSHPPISKGAKAGHYKKTHPKNTVSQGAVSPSVESQQVEVLVEYMFQNPDLLKAIQKLYKMGKMDPQNRFHTIYTTTTPDGKFWKYPELHIYDDASILPPGSQKKQPPHPSAQNAPVSPNSAYAGSKKPNPALPQKQKPSHPPAQSPEALTPHPSSAPATSLNKQKPKPSVYDEKTVEKQEEDQKDINENIEKNVKKFNNDPIKKLEGIEDFRNIDEVDSELITPLKLLSFKNTWPEKKSNINIVDGLKFEMQKEFMSMEWKNGDFMKFQNNPGKVTFSTSWEYAKGEIGTEFFTSEDEDFLIQQFQKSTFAWDPETKPKSVKIVQEGEHKGARIMEYKNHYVVLYPNDGGTVKIEVVSDESLPTGEKEESKKNSEESKELTKEQKIEQTKKFQKLLKVWGYTKKIDGDIHISEDKESQSEKAIGEAIDFSKEKMVDEEGMDDLSLEDFQDPKEKDFVSEKGLSLLEKITNFKNNRDAQVILKNNEFYDGILDGKIRLKTGKDGATIEGLAKFLENTNSEKKVKDFLNEDQTAFTTKGVQELATMGENNKKPKNETSEKKAEEQKSETPKTKPEKQDKTQNAEGQGFNVVPSGKPEDDSEKQNETPKGDSEEIDKTPKTKPEEIKIPETIVFNGQDLKPKLQNDLIKAIENDETSDISFNDKGEITMIYINITKNIPRIFTEIGIDFEGLGINPKNTKKIGWENEKGIIYASFKDVKGIDFTHKDFENLRSLNLSALESLPENIRFDTLTNLHFLDLRRLTTPISLEKINSNTSIYTNEGFKKVSDIMEEKNITDENIDQYEYVEGAVREKKTNTS